MDVWRQPPGARPRGPDANHERLRLPDAIVVACARELGGELLSYDLRLMRVAASGAASA
jgi:predicted nucleic acid-binding protein